MSIGSVTTGGFIGRIGILARDGFSAYATLPEPPASGFQYASASGLGITDQSLYFGANPPVTSADIGKVSRLTSPGGYPISVSADGIMSIAVGSDASRQTVLYNVWSAANAAFYGQQTAWVNNQAPQFSNSDVIVQLAKNATVTAPVNIYWTDGDMDTVTVNGVTALPGTLASDGTNIAGVTPNANSILDATFNGMDLTGEFTPGVIRLVIGGINPPNLIGQIVADATTALLSANLILGVVTSRADPAPIGQIVSQSVLPTAEVAYGSAVDVVTSSGPDTSGGGGTTPPPPPPVKQLVSGSTRLLRDFLLG